MPAPKPFVMPDNPPRPDELLTMAVAERALGYTSGVLRSYERLGNFDVEPAVVADQGRLPLYRWRDLLTWRLTGRRGLGYRSDLMDAEGRDLVTPSAEALARRKTRRPRFRAQSDSADTNA